MQDRVDGGFAHSHGDLHDVVVGKSSLGCQVAGRSFGVVDGLQCRIECEGDPLLVHGQQVIGYRDDSGPIRLVPHRSAIAGDQPAQNLRG